MSVYPPGSTGLISQAFSRDDNAFGEKDDIFGGFHGAFGKIMMLLVKILVLLATNDDTVCVKIVHDMFDGTDDAFGELSDVISSSDRSSFGFDVLVHISAPQGHRSQYLLQITST